MIALNPLAIELNEKIQSVNPVVFDLLSSLGQRSFVSSGILSQSMEANVKAYRLNATRAAALENDSAMYLESSRGFAPEFAPNLIYSYAPALGQIELRKQWKIQMIAENPTLEGKSFGTPIVTSGMTHGFSLIGDLFVDEGDVLVLPDKIWGNYQSIFGRKHGAEIVTYPFFNSQSRLNTHGFSECLIQAAERHQKLIVILNFPHNPTGYAINSEEAWQTTQAIKRVAEGGSQLLVIVDDAYFGLWYDGDVLHESIFGWLTNLHPNIIPVKIDGATKQEYAWGLRVGFLTFGLDEEEMKPLEEKMIALIRVSTSGAAQLSQTMVYQAMGTPEYKSEKQQKYEILKARALKVREVVYAPSYTELWEAYPFQAGYFMCIRLKQGNAEVVRQHLLDEYGIGIVSLGDNDLRIAYSCVEESEIQSLFDTIAEAIRA